MDWFRITRLQEIALDGGVSPTLHAIPLTEGQDLDPLE